MRFSFQVLLLALAAVYSAMAQSGVTDNVPSECASRRGQEHASLRLHSSSQFHRPVECHGTSRLVLGSQGPGVGRALLPLYQEYLLAYINEPAPSFAAHADSTD